MTVLDRPGRGLTLLAKYCGVSLTGFVIDVVVLRVAIHFGMEPAWGRVLSLILAMHVTFVLNGLHVFGGLERRKVVRQWAWYMLSNGFGNVMNYWIFLTLVSTHWPVIANPTFAVGVGSVSAWVFNFTATRLLVFRRLAAPKPPDAGDL